MILSNVSVPLLGATDTALLGHFSNATELGAVALGSSILSIIFWLFGFLRMGTTSVVARALGANNHNQAGQLFYQSALLALFIASGLIVLKPLLPVIVGWMGAEANTASSGLIYSQIRILAAPASLLNLVLIGWFIANKDSRSPLIMVVSQNLLNIGLDAWLIAGLNQGASGAAWASVCAEYSGLLLGLYLLRRFHPQIGPNLVEQLTSLRAYINLLQVNRDLFIRTACLLCTFAFFTAQGARQSTEVLAANAILLQLLLVVSYALDGYAHAAEALIGRAVGAKKRWRFNLTFRRCLEFSLITGLGFSGLFWLGKDLILPIFTDIPEVLALSGQYYGWLCLLPLVALWAFLLDGVFIGAGQTQAMRNSMLIAVFLVFLPIWAIANQLLPIWLGQSSTNHSLWLAFLSFMAARGVTLSLKFKEFNKSATWFAI